MVHGQRGVQKPHCRAHIPDPIEIPAHSFGMRPHGARTPFPSDRRTLLLEDTTNPGIVPPIAISRPADRFPTPVPPVLSSLFPRARLATRSETPPLRTLAMPDEDSEPPARIPCAPEPISASHRRLLRRPPEIPVPAITAGPLPLAFYFPVSCIASCTRVFSMKPPSLPFTRSRYEKLSLH